MNDIPQQPAPQGWIEALERSEAEAKAGLALSGDAVRERLRASVKRLEGQSVPQPKGEALS
jgi:hypothetical protein